MKIYLVHSVTTQSVIARAITDERTHESRLFKTGSWLQGRLFLLDLCFFKYRRFALIDENGGFFVSRLKRSANPTIVRELREWRGRTIPLEGTHVFDVVGDLCREHINVEVEVTFKCRVYNETQSLDSKRFRVVGVRVSDADDGYRLYITNLPSSEFTPEQVSAMYRARWVVELVFRELKLQYGLERFQTEKDHIVRIQVLVALLTLVVSRAILRVFVDYAAEIGDECVFPAEGWATTFWSYAQQVLSDIVMEYGYGEPNLAETWYQEARQPRHSQERLMQEVNAELYGDLWP